MAPAIISTQYMVLGLTNMKNIATTSDFEDISLELGICHRIDVF